MRQQSLIKYDNRIRYAVRELDALRTTQDLERITTHPDYGYMKDIILHRMAFARLEQGTSYAGCFAGTHDLDKIGLVYVFGRKVARRMHKATSSHHRIDWNNEMQLAEKAIDWESCHYTKPDTLEDATAHLLTCHPEHREEMQPMLEHLGFWTGEHGTDGKVLSKPAYDTMSSAVTPEMVFEELYKSRDYLICRDLW